MDQKMLLLRPTKRKVAWLRWMSKKYRMALDAAREVPVCSPAHEYRRTMYSIARSHGLPAEIARVAARDGMVGARWIGLGIGAQAWRLINKDGRWVLRIATEQHGRYLWFPIAQHDGDTLPVSGDIILTHFGSEWWAETWRPFRP